MKFSKILSLGLSLMMGASILVACGDDSGSSSGSDDASASKIKVDEKNSTIVVTEDIDEDRCVVKDKSYDMKTFTLHYETNYKYLFVADTLVLLNGAFSTVLIGGEKDELYGTWEELSNCKYDEVAKKITCKKESSSSKWFYEFTETSLIMREEGKSPIAGFFSDDYMNSSLMTEMYDVMFGEGGAFTAVSVRFVDSAGVKEAIEKYGIEVKSKDKAKETFEVGGQTFEVKVEASDIETDWNNISASVKSGDKTCEMTFEQTYIITSDLCKASNEKYFSNVDDEDENGEKYEYVFVYEKSDEDEFEKCIRDLVK